MKMGILIDAAAIAAEASSLMMVAWVYSSLVEFIWLYSNVGLTSCHLRMALVPFHTRPRSETKTSLLILITRLKIFRKIGWYLKKKIFLFFGRRRAPYDRLPVSFNAFLISLSICDIFPIAPPLSKDDFLPQWSFRLSLFSFFRNHFG